jgi:hypothetical protein
MIVLSALLGTGLLAGLLYVASKKAPPPREAETATVKEPSSGEAGRVSLGASERDPPAESAVEPRQQPKSNSVEGFQPNPRPKEEPRPPTSKDGSDFSMKPCADCKGTGVLSGDKAVEVLPRVLTEREVAQMEHGVRQLGGAWTTEERQAVYDQLFTVKKAVVELEAQKAKWNNRVYSVTCTFCGGTKWRSTAEQLK